MNLWKHNYITIWVEIKQLGSRAECRKVQLYLLKRILRRGVSSIPKACTVSFADNSGLIVRGYNMNLFVTGDQSCSYDHHSAS